LEEEILHYAEHVFRDRNMLIVQKITWRCKYVESRK